MRYILVVFFSITFCLVFFSYQFRKVFGSFFIFCWWGVLRERADISMSNMSILFIDTMVMTLIFLILISGACWNNFWCYKDIWVSFKKIRDNFFVFYLVKLKVAFINTIFWCWIWASVHTSYFDNLELIEFKRYSAPTCISKSFSNL